jgi:hypothetical protein
MISFNHILCELNVKADELSKEALSLPVGAMGLYEFWMRRPNSMEFQFYTLFYSGKFFEICVS